MPGKLSEDVILLEALHESHEQLEIALNLNKVLRAKLDSAIKLIQTNLVAPYDTDKFTSFEVTSAEYENNLALICKFDNLVIDRYVFPYIQATVFIIDGRAGIVMFFTQTPINQEDLGEQSADSNIQLSCMPTTGSMSLAQNQAILDMSTSEWIISQRISKLLRDMLSQDDLHLPRNISQEYFIAGLSSLSSCLDRWPNVLRYDNIYLQMTIHEAFYHSIEMRLENVSFGSMEVPEFIYRISTVDELGTDFGQHPRIEFPKSCANAIEQWFAESIGKHGEKLELRFGAPDAMDSFVWNRLSEQDKLFITALILNIKKHVVEASNLFPNQSQRWTEWITLAGEVKNIFVRNLSNHLTQGVQ